MDQDRFETLLREAREATKVDKERVELFEGMVRTEGWRVFVELLNARIQLYADQVLAPSQSVDGCVALEYVKGTMSGLIMARDIPGAIIASKDQLKGLPTEEDEDDNVV